MKRAALVASLIACILPNVAFGDSNAVGDGSPDSAAPAPAPNEATAAPPSEAPSRAAAPAATPYEAPPAAPGASAPPAPYSLPWQLRPAAAASVVRSDTVIALYDNAASNNGTTVVSTLLASYKITPELAPLVRIGMVQNSPPVGSSGFSFINPVLGGTYAMKLSPELRLAFFLGLAFPVGQGGGNTPDADHAAATRSGVLGRSAMDNAMFAVNDFVIFPGADLAWVQGGLTVQVEATVLQLTRARGADKQVDSSRTNFTGGLHVGYFLIPELSIGAELRHQRWLSTPAAVEKDDSLRDTTTFAVGPRIHLKLDDKLWFRPGIAYARGIDTPMTTAHYNIVQLDLPLTF